MENRSTDLLRYVFEELYEEDVLQFTCRVCQATTLFSLAATDHEIRTTLWHHLLAAHMLVTPTPAKKEG